MSGLQVEQQFDDLLSGFAVQVAGRLVGQQQVRFRAEGARQRGALLLATGKLARIVGQPMAEPDGFQAFGGTIESVRPANSIGMATFSRAVMVGTR